MMLSEEYETQEIDINDYDEIIDYAIDTCKQNRFNPQKYSSRVTTEFISDNNDVIITQIIPNNQNELQQIIKQIIIQRPMLKYNKINNIKINFLSHPIKSMLAIQMLKNDCRQRIKNKKDLYTR